MEERAVNLAHIAGPINEEYFEHVRQLAPGPSARPVGEVYSKIKLANVTAEPVSGVNAWS